MRYLSIFVLLTLTGFAYDCAPKTFTTLTHLILRPTREEKWTEIFFPNGEKTAPSVQETLKVWNEQMPEYKFIPVYSIDDTIRNGTAKFSVSENIPYYWAGFPSKETADPESVGILHACIVYFHDDRATLITTVAIKEINGKLAFSFFIETVSIEDLAKRTFYIFSLVPEGESITLIPLTDLLSLQSFN